MSEKQDRSNNAYHFKYPCCRTTSWIQCQNVTKFYDFLFVMIQQNTNQAKQPSNLLLQVRHQIRGGKEKTDHPSL